MPAFNLPAFIERQRVSGLNDFRGAVLNCRLPLPVEEINLLLAEFLKGNQTVQSVRLEAAAANRGAFEMRTRLPLFDLPGVNWLTRNFLSLDLASGSLRVEFEILPHDFSWAEAPFLFLQLPATLAGSVQAGVLRSSSLLPRLLGDLAAAVSVNGRIIRLDLRRLLERLGWGSAGPAIQALGLSTTPARFWLHLQCRVDEISPPTALSAGAAPATGSPAAVPIDHDRIGVPRLMKELMERHLATGFADFPGLRLSGQLPLREEVINEFIAQILRDGMPSVPEATPVGGAAASPDFRALLSRVKHAHVKAEAGVITLSFEFGVDESPPALEPKTESPV